jgi:hypothetical protein
MDHKTPHGLRPFVPSPHETRGSIRYLAHDDVPMATDGEDTSICSTEEMEKYESLRHREVGHTHVYDVNLLERVGIDEELPLILRTIGWGKLYEGDLMETCEGSIPIFQWRRRITRLGKRVDIHGLTTTVQGCCALATDTPTPVVDVILWSTTT